MRNQERTYAACPVLSDASVSQYLESGVVPADVHYSDVPPGKVIRNRGFWLVPSYKLHDAADQFLISTDVYAMNADDFAQHRSQLYCYRSPNVGTCYIGTRNDVESTLEPLLEGLHPPLPLDDLQYVGRVIATR